MMKKYKIILVLLVFTSGLLNTIHAQKEGNIWYFGSGNGVNFNQNCDILDLSSSMDGVEGTVSLSAPDGELLFYTNGGRNLQFGGLSNPEGKIWNRNHEVMYDMGATEGGGASSRQSSLAVPKVGSSGSYYLFTMDETEAVFLDPTGYRGFSFFEVDMNMNGGLGGVVDYQESLNIGNVPGAFSPETLGGVMKPDGSGYWIVVFDFLNGAANPDEFVKYFLADENGVTLDHVQASPEFGMPQGLNGPPIKFSPNGEYVAFSNVAVRFDATSGVYTDLMVNALSVVPFNNVIGTSFSPDSRYYFVGGENQVWRFDLMATDVPGSGTLIVELPTNASIGDIQVAPDGNLYVMQYDFNIPDEIMLSAVLCPNTEDPCFREGVYSFPSSFTQKSLPNFLDHYFESDLLERELEICLEASASAICPGEDVTLTADHYLADNFEWSNGETTASITITEPGTYSVTISDGCCSTGIAEVEIDSNAGGTLDVNIDGPTTTCNSETITLSAQSQIATDYEWSNGSTDSSIDVNEAGTYTVTVTEDACGSTVTAELVVSGGENIVFAFETQGDLGCIGEVIASTNITAGNPEVLWSTGEDTPQISITQAGSYTVTLSNPCDSKIESFELSLSEEIFEMPNAFTPDDDGFNDLFRPVWGCSDVANFDMSIYNRWGQKVFQTTDPFLGWDGKFNDKASVSDVFIYQLSFEIANGEIIKKSGDLTLIR